MSDPRTPTPDTPVEATTAPTLHRPVHPVRFVTAASLFDGHDASINIMRRILQSQGVEVIHLGHNRSVDEVVDAAVQEDVQGVAVSSYQGGHNEYFRYLVDRLEHQGYVVREAHPSDRRTTLAVLTPAGRSIIDAATRAVVDARVGLAELSDADAARLHRLLRKVRLGAGDFDSGDAHGR